MDGLRFPGSRYKHFPHILIGHGQPLVLFERGQMIGKRLYNQTCKSCGQEIAWGTPDRLVDHLAVECRLAPEQAREKAETRKNARPQKPPRCRRKGGSNGGVSSSPTPACPSSPYEAFASPTSIGEAEPNKTLLAAPVASTDGGWAEDSAGNSKTCGVENPKPEAFNADADVEESGFTTKSSPNAAGIEDFEMEVCQDFSNVEDSNPLATRKSAVEMEGPGMIASRHVDVSKDPDSTMTINFSANTGEDIPVAMEQVERESNECELTFEDFGIFLGESPLPLQSSERADEGTPTVELSEPLTTNDFREQHAMEEREETLEDLGIFLHDATQEEAHEPMSSEGDPQKDSNDLPLDLAVSYVADRYGSEQNVSQSCSTPDIVSTDHPSVSEEVFTPDQKGEVTPDSNPSLVTSPQPLNDVFDANKLEHEPAAERRGGSCGNDHPTSQQSDEMEFIVTTGDKSAPEPESKPKKTRRPPGFSCMRCRLAKKPCAPSGSSGLCPTCDKPGSVGNGSPILCRRSVLKDVFDIFSTRLYKFMVVDFTNAIGQQISTQPTRLEIKATHFVGSGIMTQRFEIFEVIPGSIRGRFLELDIHNLQKYCLDLKEKNIIPKLRSYVQSVSERIVANEKCDFLQHTLNEALKVSEKTPLLRQAVDLFAATKLLTDPSLPWEFTYPHTAGGEVVYLNHFGSRRVVAQQLYSCLEKFADDLAKRVTSELEQRLIKRTGDSRDVDLFIASVILLAVLDKYTWLYSTWCDTDDNDRNDHNSPFGKHPRSAWPLEGQDPRTFMQRFQNTAEFIVSMLRFRKIIPETSITNEGYIGAYVPVDGGFVPGLHKKNTQARENGAEDEYAIATAGIKEADQALGTASSPIIVDTPNVCGQGSNMNSSGANSSFDRSNHSSDHSNTSSSLSAPYTSNLKQPTANTFSSASGSDSNPPSKDIIHAYPPNKPPIHKTPTFSELFATSRAYRAKRECEGKSTTMDAVATWLEKSRVKANVVKSAPIMWDDAWAVWDPCDPNCWSMRLVSVLLWPRWEE